MVLDLATGIVALVAAAFGALSAGLYSTTALLRRQKDDYKSRVEQLEAEVPKLKQDIADLRTERDVLLRNIRGDDKLDAAISNQDRHYEAAREHWAHVDQRDEKLVAAVQGLRAEVHAAIERFGGAA